MIIFVAGIHGVGKTYLSTPIAQELGIRHATASQLIREERGMQPWGQSKQVSEVDENQAALVSAVRRIKTSSQSLLLDGHFVLRGEQGVCIPLAKQVFSDLEIDAVLLLQANAEVISDRLTKRGDHSWTIADLTSFAINEVTHATTIASELGLPFHILNMPTTAEFKDAINNLLAKRVHA